MRLGTGELLVILAVVIFVFGPSKLPQFGDALGRGIRNFKRASEGLEDAPAETGASQDAGASVQARADATTGSSAASV